MKILIGCEFSGVVRDAFAARGHDAWSCDLLPTERPGNHFQCDVREVLNRGWDMAIFHPPCTYLSYAGNGWLRPKGVLNESRWAKVLDGFSFFMELVNAPIPMIAIENPRGHASKMYRKPDQTIHPFHYGHIEAKATCLWMKNLPPLMATYIHPSPLWDWTDKYAPNGPGGKAKSRSKTFQGVADAMADQWGAIPERQ